MSSDHPDEGRLRAFFAEAHRDASSPPAFTDQWRTAKRRARRARRARQALGRRWALPAGALAAGLAAAALLVTITGMPRLPWPRAVERPGATLADATTPTWHGPLDHLLRTPGYEFVESVPGFTISLSLPTFEPVEERTP